MSFGFAFSNSSVPKPEDLKISLLAGVPIMIDTLFTPSIADNLFDKSINTIES